MDRRAADFARLLGAIHEEELRLLRAAGRSLTGFYVLQVLALDPGTTATQLALRLALAKSSVSFVVDELVMLSLVRRSRPHGDRRKVALYLSRKGVAWMNRFWSAKAALLWEAMDGFGAEERRLVDQILKRVAEALERRRERTGGGA